MAEAGTRRGSPWRTPSPGGPDSVATVIVAPSRGFTLQLDRLWQYRELLYFLVWRDVKVRYKQTALGVAWIVLQPLLATIVFTVVFGRLLKAPTGGLPYPLFALAALVPWQYFAGSLARASTSLVGNAQLLTKVYFPRLIVPLAAVLGCLVDFGIGLAALAALLVVYGIRPTPAVLLLPAFAMLALLTALGFGLWLSALNVRYRDVNHLTPFLLQMWLYATPVAYGTSLFPERYRWLLGLNPMTGVVEGFRWALLDQAPPARASLVSVAVTVVVLVAGTVYFRTTERTFADTV